MLPKSLQDNNKKIVWGKEKLDWWWFDPIQCWGELYNLWVKNGLKSQLLHSSRLQVTTTNGRGGHLEVLEEGVGKEKEGFRPVFPYNPELRARFKDWEGSTDRYRM